MLIIKKPSQAYAIIQQQKKKNRNIGFVPTMGALHQGHLSLVRKARRECNFLAVSIFVNPSQFLPGEDYKQYPRTFSRDKLLLKKEKVDLLFCPSVKDMYKDGFSTYVEEISLSKPLCGISRPGHFRGVCTVVAKLFNIISPDIAYFGRKDYQQALIIKRMARDLNFPVKIKVLPLVRDKDGLALSSRNRYLSEKQRQSALALNKALKLARRLIVSQNKRNPKEVRKRIIAFLNKAKGLKVDYAEILQAESLKPLKEIGGSILIALAAYAGGVRLIDNLALKIKHQDKRGKK